MRFLALAALFLSSLLACAQPHVAGLYQRDEDGSMVFNCTAFPVLRSGNVYTVLTADHCLGDFPAFIAFDDALTFYPLSEGGPSGEDYVFLKFTSPANYELFHVGDNLSLRAGDAVESQAYTFGMGEGLYRGSVIMTELTRPIVIDERQVDSSKFFAVQMPTFGGASGAPVLKDGKVVGIVVAQRRGAVAFVLKINVVK